RCQAGVCRRRMAGVTLAGGSRNVPPQRTGFPSRSVAHSPAFPSMSQRPYLFGSFLPTGWLMLSLFPAYQALLSSTALSIVQAPPAPARQASSHSASVGKRYFFPVAEASQRQNIVAERKLTLIAG